MPIKLLSQPKSSSRMLKKAKKRLLTRAAQNRNYVFASSYRAATVRESVPKAFFSSLLGPCESFKRCG